MVYRDALPHEEEVSAPPTTPESRTETQEKSRLQKITENPLFKALLVPSKLVVGGLRKTAGRTERGVSTALVVGAGAAAGAAAGVTTVVVIGGSKTVIKGSGKLAKAARKKVEANARWARRTRAGAWVRRRLGRQKEVETS